jgi:glycosyltransferase involved in cell wall biosynthesis
VTRISIAMATYNGERFLAEQLDSLAAQTLLPDELVIGDDGSSDGTEAIVRTFAAKAPFPVSFSRNPKRLGFSQNFAQVLSRCTGELLFICDQDDIWDADKIARVVARFSEHADAVAVIHDERILHQGTGITASGTVHQNVKRLKFDQFDIVSGNCTALRRAYLTLLTPFPRSVNYDYWIGWSAEILNARLVVPDVLQTYRRHEANITNPVIAAADTRWRKLPHLKSAFEDSRRLWDENVHILQAIVERLSERRPEFVALVGEPRVDDALARLEVRIGTLEARSRLVAMPRWRRWPKVLGALVSGTYSQFSGIRSALKDCLRP